jgi:xylulokinase
VSGRVGHNGEVSTPSFLAIDLGTSEMKAGLIGLDGSLLAVARLPHPVEVDAATGCAEEDPATWWAGLRGAMEVLRPAMEAPPVAICCVGQGPTLVATAADGAPTHPAITWLDRRPEAEAPALEDATGLHGWGLGILPAARWLERHEPAAASGARWYLNSWEWLALRLTGEAATSRTPGQVLPDPGRAARAGLAGSRLPAVVEAGSLLGAVGRAASEELGIAAGTPVVAGTVDSFAAFHGAGLLEAGDAVDTGGSSGGLAVYVDRQVRVPGSWVAAAPLPGRWVVGGAMTATGKALDWLAEDLLGGTMSTDALVVEAASVRPGADGLVFLPYLAGERSPLWDPRARGAFVGLTLSHGRAQLTRAVLEAAALALRHVAQPILAAGIAIAELRTSGGTARGDVWNQIKADVLGVPVGVPAIRETALAGAAVLAATGTGLVPDLRAAIDSMVRIDHRLAPNPGHRAVYDALFQTYVDLWPALAPTAHALGSLPD